MKHVSLDGSLPKGRRAVSRPSSITAEDVQDPDNLSLVITNLQNQIAELQASVPKDFSEFEVDLVPGEPVTLPHGFNAPVRFYHTHWKVENDVDVFNSLTEEANDGSSSSQAEISDSVLADLQAADLFIVLPNLGQDPGTPSGCACTNNSEKSTVFTAPNGQYSVVMRITGEMEGKAFTGGTPTGQILAGGTPNATNANYYRVTVSSPAATYYVNYNTPVVGTNYAIDQDLTLTVDAGATISLLSNAVDGFMNKGTGVGTTSTCPGITYPVLPYAGQWFRADAQSVTKL